MAEKDSWNPEQYERFKRERQAPFFDLLSMVDGRSAMRVIDLGCGTGELTAKLHETLAASETSGLDNSAAMLEKSAPFQSDRLRFLTADIASFNPVDEVDLVFSNAALHWIADHPALLQRWTDRLGPGGQLAVQVPANHDQATHTVAAEVAASKPFREELQGYVAPVHVLPPEEYARILYDLGYQEQRVVIRVYGHILSSPEDVVEWVKGTTLTVYKERLKSESYQAFLATYRDRLLAELPDRKPFFFPFKRIFLWGRK